ncbi:MAG: SRPBCC family protein [Xanthomonadaceae bacterium]|nr:SRPBCC family protein [Xanthomonadaceae bacterium]
MRLVKFAVGGVATLIILFVIVGLLLPRTVTVARVTTIEATASDVYVLVNSFERFSQWSPWQHLDPEQRIRLSGPTEGVGAEMTWASTDPSVGTGRQQIIANDPDRRVLVEFTFEEFPPARAEFTLVPDGAGRTVVTWTLVTDFGYHPVHRWVGLFFDSMVGPDYERGLVNLKALAESEAR